MVRLAALARSLPAEEYEVHFASARFDELVFAGTAFRRWPLHSISVAAAERAVAWGLRLYDVGTLADYVASDRRLIDAVRPDVIVGDLRWSLAVSGPLSGVPVVSLANAYWSPLVARDGFPLPEHPMVRLLGVKRAARWYPTAVPWVFRHFARPMNELRERHGLAAIGSLPELITWGDWTLYADPPGLIRMKRSVPATQRFLGPIHWAPEMRFDPPASRRPLIYVTLGSSGSLRVVPTVLDALSTLPVDVLLSTAGRMTSLRLPANARALPFVRGDLAARAAAAVISNGGSSTGYQALAEGTPVIGLPWNLDQYLCMTAIAGAGAGLLLRSGTATVAAIRSAVERTLEDGRLRDAVRQVAEMMRARDARAEFRRLLADIPTRAVAS